MPTIGIIGAGGKMGTRITDNLLDTTYNLLFVEPSEAGQSLLTARGVHAVPAEQAAAQSDVIILAVPDNRIGVVAASITGIMKPGATLVVLDGAAPYAGQLSYRADISYVACHPCHPSVFNRDETTAAAQCDYFGGTAARQDVVIALIRGTDADYARAEEVIRAAFAPVLSAHRITLDDLILLEPVLSETTAATCVTVIREAMEEVVSRGVPREAARAFILGHVSVELAIVFDEISSPFSDGALKAIEQARAVLFRDDWKRVFDDDAVRASVEHIVQA